MRELIDDEYNIEYSTIVRLEELWAPDPNEPDSSNDCMTDNPLEDNSSDEK